MDFVDYRDSNWAMHGNAHVDSLVGSHQLRAVDFVDYRDSNWAMVMHM